MAIVLLSVAGLDHLADWRRWVYVLVVAATKDAKNARLEEVTKDRIEATFRALIPARMLRLTTIVGYDVTRNRILEAITRCHPSPSDTLVFCWSGHGCTTSMATTSACRMAVRSTGRKSRKAMLSHHVRLTITPR